MLCYLLKIRKLLMYISKYGAWNVYFSAGTCVRRPLSALELHDLNTIRLAPFDILLISFSLRYRWIIHDTTTPHTHATGVRCMSILCRLPFLSTPAPNQLNYFANLIRSTFSKMNCISYSICQQSVRVKAFSAFLPPFFSSASSMRLWYLLWIIMQTTFPFKFPMQFIQSRNCILITFRLWWTTSELANILSNAAMRSHKCVWSKKRLANRYKCKPIT